MTERVRLPRLLGMSGALVEQARLHPVDMSITFSLRNVSTAQMTLAESDPEVKIHDWMELYTAKGSAGLFRVISVVWTVTRKRVVTLNHAIDTLNDSVWKEQRDFSGTVPEYLAALLAQQTRTWWQLGTCADTAAWKKAGINYNRLSSLLNDLTGERTGYYLAYDFSTTPWKLNFVALPEGVSAQFRLARNISSAVITRDDSEQCNRLYMTWSGKTTEDGVTTLQKEVRVYNNTSSQQRYGVIEKTANVEDDDNADPDAWAAKFLAERAEPMVQITIDGEELEALTGDTWDEYSRGKMALVALPDYGETVTERVYSVTYPDVLGAPTKVKVELNNHLDKFSETLANLKSEVASAGGAAGSAAEAAEIAQENIEAEVRRATGAERSLGQRVTENTEAITLEVTRATEEEGVLSGRITVNYNNITAEVTKRKADDDWLSGRISINADDITEEVTRATAAEETLSGRITINSDAITAEVTRAEGAEETLAGRITVTESNITAEVTNRQNADAALSGRITVNADAISAEVTRAQGAETALSGRLTITESDITTEVTDRTNADNALSSRITQNANSITLQAQTINLKADKTYVDDLVADSITANNAEIWHQVASSITTVTLNATTVNTTTVDATNLRGSNLSVGGGSYSGRAITMGGITSSGSVLSDGGINLDHSHAVTMTESGGSVVVEIGAAQAGNGTATFDIAASQTYRDGVAAARVAGANSVTLSEGSWTSSGSKVITASNGKTVTVSAPSISLSAGSWGSNHKCTVTASSADIPGGAALATLTVDASSQYSAGVTAGANSVTLTDAGWSNGHNVVSASNGQSVTVNLPTITLTGGTTWTSAHKTTVYAETAAVSGSPVATMTVDATGVYNDGYNGGWVTGHSDGYNSGYSEGYDSGYSAGYSAGETDGAGEALAGVTVSHGSWRNGSMTIAANSAAGVQLDTDTVSMPSAATWSVSASVQQHLGITVNINMTAGGYSYYYSTEI